MPVVLWHRNGRQADVSLPLPLADELGVHARLWLKLDPARGVYCAGYRPAGTVDTRYAGRTPTPADYEAARADPAGAALALVREALAAAAA